MSFDCDKSFEDALNEKSGAYVPDHEKIEF